MLPLLARTATFPSSSFPRLTAPLPLCPPLILFPHLRPSRAAVLLRLFRHSLAIPFSGLPSISASFPDPWPCSFLAPHPSSCWRRRPRPQPRAGSRCGTLFPGVLGMLGGPSRVPAQAQVQGGPTCPVPAPSSVGGPWGGCSPELQAAVRALLAYRPLHLSALSQEREGTASASASGSGSASTSDTGPSSSSSVKGTGKTNAPPQALQEHQQQALLEGPRGGRIVGEKEEEGEQGLMSSVAMPAAQAEGEDAQGPAANEAPAQTQSDYLLGKDASLAGSAEAGHGAPSPGVPGAQLSPRAGHEALPAGAKGVQAAGARVAFPPPRSRKAAVLVVMFQGTDGQVRVWLTKRAGNLSSHSGEVALPGGKRDERDVDDADTALREAEEEIGLPRSAVRVVTHLEPFLSKHLLTVTPVVAVLLRASSFRPQPNEDEVESVFSVPLSTFLETEGHRHEDHQWLGHPYRVHYFTYTPDDLMHSNGIEAGGGVGSGPQGKVHTIWGLTAAILVRVSCVVFGRSAPFGEFHPDAPNYATVLADLAKRKYLEM